MALPSTRIVRIVGAVVAVMLVAIAFYPGTLASPYVTEQDGPTYAHTIVPASSPLYDEYTDGYDHEVYQYESLSPVAQDLFDKTRAAPPRPQYNDNREFVPDVCKEFMLVCDTYHENDLPDEFTYGTELSYEEAFVFVEDGDTRYLLRTGATSHGGLFAVPFGLVSAWLTMLPLAAFVAVVTGTAESDRAVGGVLALAVGCATVGLLTPYSHLYGLAGAWPLRTVVFVAVWGSILSTGGYWLYHRVAGEG